MPGLALHQITAPGTDAFELVEIAAKTGCEQVCVFVHSPASGRSIPGGPVREFPVISPGVRKAMLHQLASSGVTIRNVEFFPLYADTDVETYRSALELGGELGGERAVTHIHDTDGARVIDTLGRFCDAAAEAGLQVGLEFMGLSAGCNSLGQALHLVEAAARANCAVAVDALHFVRTGGRPDDLRDIPPERFAYAQICDGIGDHVSADYMPEAMDRLMPGEGDFPLQAMLRALPRDLPLDVEVPSTSLAERGVSPLEHAARAVAATRRLLAAVRG